MKPSRIRFPTTPLILILAFQLFSPSAFSTLPSPPPSPFPSQPNPLDVGCSTLDVGHSGQSPPPPPPPLHQLTTLLAEHFNTPGELALDWHRERPPALTDTACFQILAHPAALAPQMLVRIRIQPNTTDNSTGGAPPPTDITLVLRAQLWRDGWLLPTPATRGDPVYLPALTLKRYDALRDRDAVPAEPDADLIYARAVPAGRLLTWRDVIRRPLVRRGQLIEIAANEGPLSITLRGIALEDAGRGEIVRVRNPESRKEFTALVTAESAARVTF
ncbi:flagellar basal body P-ring formation protein FlgA [Opitutaceae bacterium TAV3]|nr:flagellar basal body P-ring formation protein FlgA [Opitutaceae bacterium TAV3]